MSMGWKGQGQSGFKGQRGSGKSGRDGAWGKVIPNPKLKLMDQVREVMRLKHYSIRTERCYCDWIRRYIRFHKMLKREELTQGAEAKMELFLECRSGMALAICVSRARFVGGSAVRAEAAASPGRGDHPSGCKAAQIFGPSRRCSGMTTFPRP
jgi:Phage integrase, N-terminal SAM-like domain